MRGMDGDVIYINIFKVEEIEFYNLIFAFAFGAKIYIYSDHKTHQSQI